jgi:RNA methyltransferase, TrmH family
MLSRLDHPFVKHLVKLRVNRKYRHDKKCALIMGNKLIEDLSQEITFQTLIVEKNYPIPKGLSFEEAVEVTPSLLKKITALENPEPLAAVIALPKQGLLNEKKFILAFDGVADPGNVGTLLRTALGLGWEGAFFLPTSCDPFNDKALRAAKGATFRLPLRQGSEKELEDLVRKNKMNVYLADIDGTSIRQQLWSSPLLLILGNESQGPSSFSKKIAHCVRIPMTDKIESLNVGIAGAILMYYIKENA